MLVCGLHAEGDDRWDDPDRSRGNIAVMDVDAGDFVEEWAGDPAPCCGLAVVPHQYVAMSASVARVCFVYEVSLTIPTSLPPSNPV